ncbi:putative membrane protein [Nakamurella sp. UYEF19]|uniref:hypothetical protein n=1 Tax=Nakamurella sp. UYEF19 TaxID=1756392 RepID=UPI003399C809
MVVDGERYPAPATEHAKRRRRLKNLLIALGLLLVLMIVALQLKSIIDPPRAYMHG